MLKPREAGSPELVCVCNALVDILVEASDDDLAGLGLRKAGMHLVDAARQKELLEYFGRSPQVVEVGGSGMNVSRAVAALGVPVVFAGMIGQDDFGHRIETRLGELAIHCHVARGEHPTGSCVILVTPDGERTMNTHLGASRLYDESLVPVEHIQRARVLHFCGYQWDTPGQKRAIERAMEVAAASGTRISLDVADPMCVENHRDVFRDMIRDRADIVFANREEARILYGGSPEDAAREIAKAGALAVIKLGAEGALVQSGDRVERIAPVATQVVDTTAAGDMFAGGFLYGALRGLDPRASGRVAAELASDVIRRVGARLDPAVLARVRLAPAA